VMVVVDVLQVVEVNALLKVLRDKIAKRLL